MRTLLYFLAQAIAVFLTVSVLFTVLTVFMPSYRQQLEPVMYSTLIVAELWALLRGARLRFKTRTLLIVATIEGLVLGAWAALKR